MESIFTVPADFKKETVSKFLKLNNNFDVKVTEFYGSIKSSKIGSGRKYFELPEINENELRDYIAFCKENNIKFNYTLNLSCANNKEFTEEGRTELIAEIRKLVDLGITDFTIALPSLIELFNQEFPNIDITLSIITGIDSLSKMETFCQYENIKNIYIHERVYRQIELMKNLIELGHKYNKKIGMIVNSFCLSDCPYRQYHYNFGAHATYGSSYIIPEYYGSKCALMKINDKRNVLNSPWVRPEDLKKYMEIGIDRFKISGREMHADNADMFKMVETYNNFKFDGNLAELFMCFTKCAYSEVFNIKNDENLNNYLEEVFSGENKCNINGCNNCMKCKDALKSIEINKNGKAKWSKIFEDRIKKFKEKV